MLLLLITLRSKPLLLISLFLITFGCFRYSIETFHTSRHISSVIPKLGNENLHITGEISEEPQYDSGKTKFEMQIHKIDSLKIKGKILVLITGKCSLSCGDVIEYFGKVRKPYKNTNPYSFNYSEFLENRGIYGISFLYHQNIKVVGSETNLLSTWVIPVRKWIRGKIEKLYPRTESGFLKAILLGEKTSLPHNLREDFANSGLAHILAVSGLHTGVIALIFLTLFQIIFRNKTVARIVTILMLLYYVLLSHAVPSVQRAVIMITLLLMVKFYRKKQIA